jgi:propanol-preferring alcohol dehydrogenase
MQLHTIASLDDEPDPLVLADIPAPTAREHEVLLQVSACGVCHTELDEIEGRTPPPRLPVVPGHEVIGRVVARGSKADRFTEGQRVGVGWIHSSSGRHDENIDERFVATGRDVDGGYAEYMTVDERYAYPIPASFSDEEAAPLLCAGGVGFRALKRTGLRNGEILGLTGFGGSGHLVLQLCRFLYPESDVIVFARSEKERDFARHLGASWAGDTGEEPPEAPHAIIDTTPAWKPVLAALSCLRPGGRLVINAIRKEDTDRHLMADIDYASQLWQEKSITSVANVTAADIHTLLQVAAEAGIRPEVETYPLEAANEALRSLRAGHVRGAKVLKII